jgi:predicted transcriptional regulator
MIPMEGMNGRWPGPFIDKLGMMSMKLAEVVSVLEATTLNGADELDCEITRCGGSDLMSDVLARPTDGSLLMTGLTTVQAIRTAKIAGVVAVIFVRGKQPAPEVIKVARAEGVPIFSSPHSMFVCCGRLHGRGLTGLDGRR